MADLGWYPDPAGRHEFRFFDGTRWTDHVADEDTPSIDPVPRAPLAVVPVRVVDDRGRSTLTERWSRRKVRWAACAVAAVIGIAAATSSDDGGVMRVETDTVTTAPNAPASVPSTTVAVVLSEAPTVPPPTVAPTIRVPTTTTAPAPAPKAPPATFATVSIAGPEPASDCHPSYRPCIPFARDVDCAGGSGNGPEYTGRVEVIGPDDYDLDRDHDGIGCE
jgi:hypothetical protein